MHTGKPQKYILFMYPKVPVETIQEKGGSSVSQMQLNIFQLDMNLTFPFGANLEHLIVIFLTFTTTCNEH